MGHAFINNGHLIGPVTHAHAHTHTHTHAHKHTHTHTFVERLEVVLSLPISTTYVCRGWNVNTQPSACGANPLRHRRSYLSVSIVYKQIK